MKVLTVRQPWASAIVRGLKDIENRTWPTNYRGELLIHAGSAKPSKELIATYERLYGALPEGMVYGAIVGKVTVTDCVADSDSPWAFGGHWHWKLSEAVEIDPFPCSGQLSFWAPPKGFSLGKKRK